MILRPNPIAFFHVWSENMESVVLASVKKCEISFIRILFNNFYASPTYFSAVVFL